MRLAGTRGRARLLWALRNIEYLLKALNQGGSSFGSKRVEIALALLHRGPPNEVDPDLPRLFETAKSEPAGTPTVVSADFEALKSQIEAMRADLKTVVESSAKRVEEKSSAASRPRRGSRISCARSGRSRSASRSRISHRQSRSGRRPPTEPLALARACHSSLTQYRWLIFARVSFSMRASAASPPVWGV